MPAPRPRRAGLRTALGAALVAASIGATACTGQASPVAATKPTSATPARSSAAATPSPTPPSASPSRTPHPVTLAFGGDVHFEGVDGRRLRDDPATAMGPVAAILKRADLAMVNLETAITDRGTPAAKKYTFRAPATAFTALRAAGVDVVTMANNHGMDYGVVGLQDSLAAAAAAHFPVVGIGSDAARAFAPYRVTVHGDRIAIIGATQVLDSNLASAWTAGADKPGLASAKDEPRLLAAVRAARADADTVVVYLHWGQEMNPCPLDRQRSLADDLIAAGADVVVGSHAHVLLGGGWHGPDAYVDYGLGNFVFYARGGVTARSGVLLLTVAGRAVTKARWVPAQIAGGVPVPATGTTATDDLRQWNDLRTCTGLAATPGR